MRRFLAGAAAVLLLAVLGGCGEDPIAAYCTQVQSDRKQLAEMTSDEAGGATLLEHLPMLHELGEKSPSDLADEWQTFLNALDNLDKALRKAKVAPEDFKAGKPPEGVSAAQLTAIQEAASQIGEPDVVEAVRAIEQQARDVCKVNVGL